MLYEPDYGEVKALLKRWGNEEELGLNFIDLTYAPCSEKELGLGPLGFDNLDSRFYPIQEAQSLWFEFYWKKLNCV